MEAYSFRPGREDPGNPNLVAEVRARIRRAGRITFAEFMEVVLYHPEHGYYSAPGEKLGPEGDFITSPEVHPSFGALIARQLEEMWRRLQCPRPFAVVEVGPGRGTLARDMLSYAPFLGADFHRGLAYRLVEVSPSLRASQQEILRPWADRIAWVGSVEAMAPASVTGCFLANEVLDALPVHVVAMTDGRLREVYVTWKDGRFAEEMGEPSTPELARYFDRLGIHLPEGCRGEVNLGVAGWLAAVARALRRGYGLVLDYGDAAAELYSARRPRGTLLCHYRHTTNENPYRRLGRQDITAHVDFTSLALEAHRAALGTAGPVTQQHFLRQMGLAGYLEALSDQPLPMVERRANQVAIEDLADPAGLGGFLVLALLKDVPEATLTGLSSGEPLPLPSGLPVPLLTPAPAPGPDFSDLWADVQWGEGPGKQRD